MEELNPAIANTSNAMSFDTDGIHLTMIKKMGYKDLERIHRTFNNWGRLHHGLGKNLELPSSASRVNRYDDYSSYRPLSFSRHFGKLLERISTNRIDKYLNLHKIIEEREILRTEIITVRLRYRLHISMERAEESELPTALLIVDLEKAFDSIWISGRLYKLQNYNIAREMIRILESFLRNREAFI